MKTYNEKYKNVLLTKIQVLVKNKNKTHCFVYQTVVFVAKKKTIFIKNQELSND